MSSSPNLPETGTRVNQDADPMDVREQTRNEDGAGRGNGDTTIDALIPEIAGVQEEPVSASVTPEQHVPAETMEAMTASTSHLVLPQVDDQAKVDKLDKNSVATTLTSTLVHSQQTRSSRRRVNGTSTSEGASSSVATEKQKTPSQRQKSSLLSSIFRKLLPCIGPSRSHDTGIGDMDNIGLGTPEAEKQDAADSSDRIMEDPSIGLSTSDAQISGSLTVPSALLPPPTTTDSEIIIPPRPSSQLLPLSETEGVTSGAVQPPGSTGDPITMGNITDAEEDGDDDAEFEDVLEDDEEDRLIRSGGNGIPIGDDGVPRPLLPPIAPQHVGRKCLVLDLDETLVHSSFRSVPHADFIVPVQIEHHWHNFYVLKRPGVDNFLKKMGEIYEVVVFTASLSTYADPVMDKLDIHQVVAHRLFRESCYNHRGNYVKDLSQLGRRMQDTIILDNSPASYIFHQNNAVPVSSWFNDPHDTELTDLCPFLADLCGVDDVRGILDGGLT